MKENVDNKVNTDNESIESEKDNNVDIKDNKENKDGVEDKDSTENKDAIEDKKEKTEKDKSKKSDKALIIVSASIILAAIAIVAVYFVFFSKPPREMPDYSVDTVEFGYYTGELPSTAVMDLNYDETYEGYYSECSINTNVQVGIRKRSRAVRMNADTAIDLSRDERYFDDSIRVIDEELNTNKNKNYYGVEYHTFKMTYERYKKEKCVYAIAFLHISHDSYLYAEFEYETKLSEKMEPMIAYFIDSIRLNNDKKPKYVIELYETSVDDYIEAYEDRDTSSYFSSSDYSDQRKAYRTIKTKFDKISSKDLSEEDKKYYDVVNKRCYRKLKDAGLEQ